jgi:MOSC domain-containing protein YiiM
LVGRDEHNVSVADITRLYARDKSDFETMRRAIAVEALPDSWRGHFRQQLLRGGA